MKTLELAINLSENMPLENAVNYLREHDHTGLEIILDGIFATPVCQISTPEICDNVIIHDLQPEIYILVAKTHKTIMQEVSMFL